LLEESILLFEEIQIFAISLFRLSFNAEKPVPKHSEALRAELVDWRICALPGRMRDSIVVISVSHGVPSKIRRMRKGLQDTYFAL
jgi:hypothetical protein